MFFFPLLIVLLVVFSCIIGIKFWRRYFRVKVDYPVEMPWKNEIRLKNMNFWYIVPVCLTILALGLGLLNLLQLIKQCKPSVQVKTWTLLWFSGIRFSFGLTAMTQKCGSQVEILRAVYLVLSKAVGHVLVFLLYLLSLGKCDSFAACLFKPLLLEPHSPSVSLSSLTHSLSLCHMWKWSN